MLKSLVRINLVKLLKLQNKERQVIFAVIVVIVISLNLLVSTFALRLDASSGKAYTLSDSSRKVLRNLDDLVNIKFVVSSDLPAKLLPLKTDVLDTLEEYKKEGRGRIQLKIVDPKKDEASAKEAREANIPELQFSQLEQDKYAVTTAYFGIFLSHGGGNESIPQVTDFENLEYNLTSAIYKLVKKDLPKIGIIGEPVSPDPSQDNLASFKKILSQQFVLENIDTSTEQTTKAIDQSFKTVVVLDNNIKEYTAAELKILKDYLNKKGKMIVFADGVWVSEQLTASEAKHNLFSLLGDYGINLEKNLILSNTSEIVNFGATQMSVLIPYPFWFKTNNFNSKTSYFSNINQVTYPWGSSIKLDKKNNFEVEELVKTTSGSWDVKNSSGSGIVLNPQGIQSPKESDYRQFLVAAIVSKKDSGQIVIIPSSRFILERYLGEGSSNLEFILNIANNLASDGALSGIRSRAVSFYPLPDLNQSQKDIFKYLNILFLPVLFGVWGAFKLIKRR